MEIQETQNLENGAVETPAAEEPKVHPAYEKLLNELPEVLHGKVTPYLQEQDRYFQQQLEKYTEYKEYAEKGIGREVIDGGIGLINAIDNDPVEVYNQLQAYLKEQGLLAEDAKAAARDVMESQSGENFEDLFDGEEVPAAVKKELAELRKAQEEQQNYLQQQQLEKQTEIELQTLTSEMDSLKGSYQLTEAHEVAIYDLMNSALNAGRVISLNDAAAQLSKMIGGFTPVNAQTSAAAAPTIVGSQGGAGVQSPELKLPADSRGKKEMLAQLFEDYKRANQ